MITIGTDPELFLRDTRSGSVHSAVGLFGGTKAKPIPMEGKADGFAVQEDNVMVEYNVPPATMATRFARRVTEGLLWIDDVVRTTQKDLELDIGACSRLFPHHQLDSSQARMFGCSPDFNAHAQGQPWPSIKPELLLEDDGGWRFAGGHVHLGFDADIPDFVCAAFADVYLGLPSVGLDQQGPRRMLYGQAGRYRPTEWGIEYRTLSNFWIWETNMAQQIGARAVALGKFLEQDDKGAIQSMYAEVPWSDVTDAINTEDEGKAADLLVYLTTDLGLGGL